LVLERYEAGYGDTETDLGTEFRTELRADFDLRGAALRRQ